MASINNILRNYLKSKDEIIDLIGSGTSCRIMPEGHDLEDPVFPYLTTEHIADEGNHNLGGSSAFKTSTVDIHAKGKTNKEAEELAEAVRLVLDGKRGDAAGTFLHYCHKTDYDTNVIDRGVGDDKSLFIHTVTFDITISEAAPTL